RRPLSLILSGGGILQSALTANDLLTLARDPATGLASWGPVAYSSIGPGGVRVTDVSQDSAGNVLVTGNNSGGQYATVKLARADGTILWGPVLSQTPKFYPMMVRANAAGDVFVLGASGDVLKYNGTTGALIWEKTPGANLSGWRVAIDSS